MMIALLVFTLWAILCLAAYLHYDAPVGTRSVLYGYHAFYLHPLFVARGWYALYGWRRVQIGIRSVHDHGATVYVRVWTSLLDPRLWLSFFLHDLGYLGSPNMDGPEGERHRLDDRCRVLEERNAELTKQRDASDSERLDVVERCIKAEARVASLAEDARRLDWLAKKGVILDDDMQEETLGASYYRGETTLREAIDAARSSSGSVSPTTTSETTDEAR